jgi:hypothetical protein
MDTTVDYSCSIGNRCIEASLITLFSYFFRIKFIPLSNIIQKELCTLSILLLRILYLFGIDLTEGINLFYIIL